MLDSLLNPIKLPDFNSIKRHEGKGNFAVSKYYKFPYRPFYRKKLYMVRDLLDKDRVYDNILDFGAGPGIFTQELKEHALRVVSVNKDEVTDKRSRFECIVSASTLEFIEDLPKTMLSLYQIASSKGQM